MVTSAPGAAPARTPGGTDRPRRRNRPWGIRVAPYLFILPNMVIFGLFTIWPAINGFNISLYESPNGRVIRYVGLGNYQQILGDPEFWGIARQTALYAVAFVVGTTVLAIAVAVLVDQQHRGKTFFRGVFFVPVLVSPVVVGLVWNWLLERQGGLVNSTFGTSVSWLVDANWAMVSIIIVGLWMQVGFFMLIALAGLQGIDPSIYEASRMDGASRWKQFWSMTLPLLQPSIVVIVVLATIRGFEAFDFIFTLTGGGPTGATTLIVQFIYENGFVSPIRYGHAAAAGVILFVVIFTLTLINWAISRRKEAV